MIDVARYYREAEDTAARATSPYMAGLRGSDILAIAGQVRALQGQGRKVFNLTIGDFDPKHFPIPDALREAIHAAYDEGHTNYPPAIGVPELRDAIRQMYREELGLDFPDDAILAGSGARPPIFGSFGVIVGEGDVVVYPVPSWNINHYTFLNRGRPVPLVTTPESGFMPTAAQIRPHIHEARIVLINSPSNPAGTVIAPDALAEICDLVLEENGRRNAAGERPVILVYDAVYWKLTFGEARHVMPQQVRPEIAPYCVIIDGISKWWAGTGLRVGWVVAPPWIRAKMAAYVGHMGAWAAKAEQIATARVLAHPGLTADFLIGFKGRLQQRFAALEGGIAELSASGYPIRSLRGEGAIYLSVQLDILGRAAPDGTRLDTDEAVRSYILEHAGVAVVPFPAFGYPQGSGWMRMSIGAISQDDAEGTVAALRAALEPFRRPV
jgi:aspartate aminotransferase